MDPVPDCRDCGDTPDKVVMLAERAARIAGAKTREIQTITGRRGGAELRGQRLVDLCLNAIEIIDRNLYERTCDVRWWATDAAVTDAVRPDHERSRTERRLGIILDSYTVYLDIWVCRRNGTVVANGRPERYPDVAGTDVLRESWFQQAMAACSANDFAVADVARCAVLGRGAVATYPAPIRAAGFWPRRTGVAN